MKRNLVELWRYRTLIWALVSRHLNARYRGSLLGFLWSFLNPLCLIAVYSLVFRYYMRTAGVDNYTLYLFAGLLPWIWFSTGLLEATGSISSTGSLITKAMFPPHILPAVAVLTNLANFIFAIPLLLAVMFYSGVAPGLGLLFLPLILFIEAVFLLGISLAFSALNVHYRDVQHILGNVMTLWFFLTPIIYRPQDVPEEIYLSLVLNPIAHFTEMYQHIFYAGQNPSMRSLAVTAGIAVVTLFLGSAIFNRYREEFAELV